MSCNNGEDVIYEATKYKVSVVNTNDYTINVDKSEGTVNTLITVDIDLNNTNIYLTDVLYNGISFFNDNATSYSFFMPESDVSITATTANYKEKLVSDSTSKPFATFRSTDSKTLAKGTGNAVFHIDFNGSYMTILKCDITSTNINILSNSDIAISYEYASTSNLIVTADFAINTTNLKNSGSTWLIFSLENGNVSSRKGTLNIPVTVE
jgi:hypothetical protein